MCLVGTEVSGDRIRLVLCADWNVRDERLAVVVQDADDVVRHLCVRDLDDAAGRRPDIIGRCGGGHSRDRHR